MERQGLLFDPVRYDDSVAEERIATAGNAYFQKMRTFDRRDISMEGAPVDADSDNGSLPLGGT